MADVIDWPTDIIPNEMSIGLEGLTRDFESMSGSTQTLAIPGSKVTAQLTFRNLPAPVAKRLKALVFSLEGTSGRVRIWDFSSQLVGNPQPVLGHPVVTEAISMKKQFTSRGWTPSRRVLSLGDWVQVGDELKMVLADVYSDAAGTALVRISPMVRQNYPSGTPLVVARPCGVFKLQDNKQGVFHHSPGVFTDVTLSLIEAFYP